MATKTPQIRTIKVVAAGSIPPGAVPTSLTATAIGTLTGAGGGGGGGTALQTMTIPVIGHNFTTGKSSSSTTIRPLRPMTTTSTTTQLTIRPVGAAGAGIPPGTVIRTTGPAGQQLTQLTLPNNAKIIPGTGGQPPRITFTPIDPANISQVSQTGNRIVVLVPVSAGSAAAAAARQGGKAQPTYSISTSAFGANVANSGSAAGNGGTITITGTGSGAGQQTLMKQSVMVPFISKLPAGASITSTSSGQPAVRTVTIGSGSASAFSQMVVSRAILTNTSTGSIVAQAKGTFTPTSSSSSSSSSSSMSTATPILTNGTTLVITSGAPQGHSLSGPIRLTATTSQPPVLTSSSTTSTKTPQNIKPDPFAHVFRPVERPIQIPKTLITGIPIKPDPIFLTSEQAKALINSSSAKAPGSSAPVILAKPIPVSSVPISTPLTCITSLPKSVPVPGSTSTTTVVRKTSISKIVIPQEMAPQLVFKQANTGEMSSAFKQILASTKLGQTFTIPVAMAPQAIVAQLTNKVGKKITINSVVNVASALSTATTTNITTTATATVPIKANNNSNNNSNNNKTRQKKTPTVTVVPNPVPTFRPIVPAIKQEVPDAASITRKIAPLPKAGSRAKNATKKAPPQAKKKATPAKKAPNKKAAPSGLPVPACTTSVPTAIVSTTTTALIASTTSVILPTPITLFSPAPQCISSTPITPFSPLPQCILPTLTVTKATESAVTSLSNNFVSPQAESISTPISVCVKTLVTSNNQATTKFEEDNSNINKETPDSLSRLEPAILGSCNPLNPSYIVGRSNNVANSSTEIVSNYSSLPTVNTGLPVFQQNYIPINSSLFGSSLRVPPRTHIFPEGSLLKQTSPYDNYCYSPPFTTASSTVPYAYSSEDVSPQTCTSYCPSPPKRIKHDDASTEVTILKLPKESNLSRAIKYYMKEVYDKNIVF